MTEQLFMDRKAAAKTTGLSVDVLTSAIKAGKLRAKRSGVRVLDDGTEVPVGKYLITREALMEWYDQLEDAG